LARIINPRQLGYSGYNNVVGTDYNRANGTDYNRANGTDYNRANGTDYNRANGTDYKSAPAEMKSNHLRARRSQIRASGNEEQSFASSAKPNPRQRK